MRLSGRSLARLPNPDLSGRIVRTNKRAVRIDPATLGANDVLNVLVARDLIKAQEQPTFEQRIPSIKGLGHLECGSPARPGWNQGGRPRRFFDREKELDLFEQAVRIVRGDSA